MKSLKDPKVRIKYAWGLLIFSLVGMVLNVSLYLAKVINESMLILVTLILSWLAITITCIDVLISSDVRKEQDK